MLGVSQAKDQRVVIKVLWKAGCRENLHVRFGVGAQAKFLGLHHFFWEAKRLGRGRLFSTPSWLVRSVIESSRGAMFVICYFN
jgi:hypothetical protein